MARFRKGSKEAKAWGRRMRELRERYNYIAKKTGDKRHGHKRRKALTHPKKKIRHFVKRASRVINHPFRSIRKYRKRYKTSKKKMIYQLSLEDLGALGIITSVGVNMFGFTPKQVPPGTTTTTTTTSTTTPGNTGSNIGTQVPAVTLSAVYQGYGTGPNAGLQQVLLRYTGWFGNSNLTINAVGVTDATDTQQFTAYTDANGNGQLELGYSPDNMTQTVTYTVVYNGVNITDPVSVSMPAILGPATMSPPASTPTLTLNASNNGTATGAGFGGNNNVRITVNVTGPQWNAAYGSSGTTITTSTTTDNNGNFTVNGLIGKGNGLSNLTVTASGASGSASAAITIST